MLWSGRHVKVAFGELMVAVGGSLPAVTISGSDTLEMLFWSVTFRRATYFPGFVYVNMGSGATESSNWPSPSRSHAKVIVSPGWAGAEPALENWTVSGVSPYSGVPEATAAGPYSTRMMRPPEMST